MKPKTRKVMDYNAARVYVFRDGDLLKFTKAEIVELSETALNCKDGDFFDKLQLFYDLKKSVNEL